MTPRACQVPGCEILPEGRRGFCQACWPLVPPLFRRALRTAAAGLLASAYESSLRQAATFLATENRRSA